MEDKHIKVLLIEDNPGDARLVQEMLAKVKGASFDFECADRLSTGLEYLVDDRIDVVLLDIGLPDSQGLDTFDRTYAQAPEVPIVMLTVLDDEALALKAVQKGAQDYLVKGQVDSNLLARAISYAIERKRAEEALRDSEERLKTTIDSINAGIIIIDPESHKIIDANKVAVEMIDAPKEEILGYVCHKFVCPAEEGKCPITDLGQDVDNAERILLNSSGETIPILKTVVPITIKGKKHLVESFVDITERKQAEKELENYARELQESNRLKDLFTDIMTHDLLSPAAAIKSAAELMLEEAGDTERKTLEVIEWGAKKQIDIIESASKLSKLKSAEELEKESLDLKEVIDRVIEDTRPLFEAAGMRVENKATKPLPLKANFVIGDVFYNLLSNAAKYAAEGEKVVIEALDEDEGYTVMVEDYGPGIPDGDKDGIFKRFMRDDKASVKGTGLGLAIAKCIVDLHRGKIWVEDNPKGGAVFKVSLPK